MKDKFDMVGKKIPEINLPNSREETININQFYGKKNVVVIMLRGIMWPYCRAHIRRLARDFEKFEELNTVLYPITPDKEKNAKKLETKYALNKFPIYYDPKKTVLKMLKQEVNWKKLGRMPALLILDKEGIIQYAYYGNSMKDIPKNIILFEELEKLQN